MALAILCLVGTAQGQTAKLQDKPGVFVKEGRPLSLWIKKHINNIQVDWLDHRWIHGFEVFDPSKDILVEQLIEYFKSDQSLWAGKLNL